MGSLREQCSEKVGWSSGGRRAFLVGVRGRVVHCFRVSTLLKDFPGVVYVVVVVVADRGSRSGGAEAARGLGHHARRDRLLPHHRRGDGHSGEIDIKVVLSPLADETIKQRAWSPNLPRPMKPTTFLRQSRTLAMPSEMLVLSIPCLFGLV